MKIGVIMGGISSEREISLNSGRSIVENINKDKYESAKESARKAARKAQEKQQEKRPS